MPINKLCSFSLLTLNSRFNLCACPTRECTCTTSSVIEAEAITRMEQCLQWVSSNVGTQKHIPRQEFYWLSSFPVFLGTYLAFNQGLSLQTGIEPMLQSLISQVQWQTKSHTLRQGSTGTSHESIFLLFLPWYINFRCCRCIAHTAVPHALALARLLVANKANLDLCWAMFQHLEKKIWYTVDEEHSKMKDNH